MTKQKPTIAVLFGGRSNEYQVSLHSAAAVIDNIDRNKYQLILIGINQKGEWFRFCGDTSKIANDSWQNELDCVKACILPCSGARGILQQGSTDIIKVDAALPVMHGKYGEDGTIQGLLELAQIPIIGCGTLSSALCMDKMRSHAVVSAAGINIPWGIALTANNIDEAMEQIKALRYPLFVKPSRSGSSIGISCVQSYQELNEAIETALLIDNEIIIEETVKGVEVGCAIIGSGNNTIIGAVDEIELQNGFFDYREKYSLATARIHLPARIDEQTTDKIKKTALKIYHLLGCSGFARVDMFLGEDNEIYFNEVNTIPGFTASSRFPRMMQGIGYSFPELISKIIETVVKKPC